MLGGSDGKTLFVLTASDSTPEEASSTKTGKIYSVRVDHSRAGCP
jgi:sugar lactone lactonase YvrE